MCANAPAQLRQPRPGKQIIAPSGQQATIHVLRQALSSQSFPVNILASVRLFTIKYHKTVSPVFSQNEPIPSFHALPSRRH
jgi:hypothetical protein